MRYRVNPDFVMVHVDGEALLVRLDSRVGVIPKASSMNATASLYWKMLEEGLDTCEMLERMKALCKTDVSILETGLKNFLASLEAAGALCPE